MYSNRKNDLLDWYYTGIKVPFSFFINILQVKSDLPKWQDQKGWISQSHFSSIGFNWGNGCSSGTKWKCLTTIEKIFIGILGIIRFFDYFVFKHVATPTHINNILQIKADFKKRAKGSVSAKERNLDGSISFENLF